MAAELSIGQLAEAAGVNIESIRYYQRRGLLPEPPKPPGRHRRYSTAHIGQLQFIRRAQALGFTLAEIQELLHLDSTHACADTYALAAHKLELIDQKLKELHTLRTVLAALAETCHEGAAALCPIIAALSPKGV